ncbi:kinase-regulated stress-responsive transcription factor skn7 [Tilletia horrida]|nr:kinase-regulated stress-responsive transcription factor skn7 [Tilletia horrida]
MMGPQTMFATPHMPTQGPEPAMFGPPPQQQQQHQIQQRPNSGGGMRPPQQPIPVPGFHHPQMPASGPYGPNTPSHVNLSAGGYFGAAPALQQQLPGPPTQPQPQSQQRMEPPPVQSQHAMMMPPPPGAMPPIPKGAHLSAQLGGMGMGMGIGVGALDHAGLSIPGGHFPVPPDAAVQGAAGSSIALPPLPSKGASDFVKKLFNMLDDELYEPIVSWGPTGDSFVVKNMNDFTKHVLPRHFRHSNFASFVRQLNKYDFHKVKNANSNDDMDPMAGISASGDQIWEFKHPDFVRGREDLLENVKRKAPTTKKGAKAGDDRDGSPPVAENPNELAVKAAEGYTELKGQVENLTAVQEQMNRHINGLTKQYQGIIGEMLTFQRNMVQQDQLMQNLIQYLMNMENERSSKDGGQGKLEDGGSGSRQLLNAAGPFVQPQDARQLIGSYSEVARASFSQMSEITKRIQSAQQSLRADPAASASAPIPPTASIQDIGPSSTSSTEATGQSGRIVSPKWTQDTSPGEAFTPGGSREVSIAQRRHGFSTGSTATSPTQPTMYLHPPHFNDDGAGDFFNPAAAFGAGHLGSMEAAGLRVFTVGTLQRREDLPPEDYLNLQTPGVQGENGNLAHGNEPDGRNQQPGSSRGTPDNHGEGANGMKLMVPNLEELPEGMPKLDRRTSIVPGGNPTPGNKSPSPLGNAAGGGASPHHSDAGIPLIPHLPGSGANGNNGSSVLRVRRSTYVPGWAVPPRVLLVDDDAVCRKLSSKFLQVFGCAIDVAVDGVNAVNKMNLEKYDLVLMDIVMPNLDGVSATSLIRQFDPRTPIISMTSNSQPNELLTYMQNGMTDVLPKPFTKEGLLGMLEKHLIHLKTVTQMEQIPRQLGLPSLPEGALQSMISSAAGLAPGLAGIVPTPAGPSGNPHLRLTSAQTGGDEDGDEDGSMNPLASLGFSDTEYIAMLQNFIASGSVTDSSQGEITSTLAQAVGASLGEGQGGARRPSQAVLLGFANNAANAAPIPGARKRRSDKMDLPPGSSGEATSEESPASSSTSGAASASSLISQSPVTGHAGAPLSRKRQRTAGSG